MPRFTREELQQALESYNKARDEASKTGDWSIWAAVFTEDADYIEHAYGSFKGRAAITDWITKVMAPFPHMTFPQDWVAFDEDAERFEKAVVPEVGEARSCARSAQQRVDVESKRSTCQPRAEAVGQADRDRETGAAVVVDPGQP